MKKLVLIVLSLCALICVLEARSSWGQLGRSCTPQDCVLYDWSTVKGCSKTCGGGHLIQRRKIKQKPRCCGTACLSRNSSQRRRRVSCNTQCCPVNCAWSWNAWSPCQGCGVSKQTRTMRITRNPLCGGKAAYPLSTLVPYSTRAFRVSSAKPRLSRV